MKIPKKVFELDDSYVFSEPAKQEDTEMSVDCGKTINNFKQETPTANRIQNLVEEIK